MSLLKTGLTRSEPSWGLRGPSQGYDVVWTVRGEDYHLQHEPTPFPRPPCLVSSFWSSKDKKSMFIWRTIGSSFTCYPTLHLRINRVRPYTNPGVFTFTFTVSLRSCRQGRLQSRLAVLVRRRFTLAVMFRVHLSDKPLLRIPLYFPLSSNISRHIFFVNSTCGCLSYDLRMNDEIFRICTTCVFHVAHVK